MALLKCPCCGSMLHPDDFPGPGRYQVTEVDMASLLDRYGRLPCSGCADSHQNCATCGTATEREEMSEVSGDFYCPECADDAAREYAEERAEWRRDQRIWERQR